LIEHVLTLFVRRTASELIKGLRRQFELPLTQLFTSYINTLLEQYKSNPEANWQAKDAALYLVTALTVPIVLRSISISL
jgi:exportin-2 (importin alpha re-exporter)